MLKKLAVVGASIAAPTAMPVSAVASDGYDGDHDYYCYYKP